MINQDENNLEQGLSLSIGKASVQLASVKEINEFDLNVDEKSSEIFEWFDGKINQLKEKISGEKKVELYESHGSFLALKDVVLVLTFIYENHGSIIKSKEPLDQQIVNAINLNKIKEILMNAKLQKNEKSSAGCCTSCIIY